MKRNLVNIKKTKTDLILSYINDSEDYLTDFFLLRNAAADLWTIEGLERRIIASVDESRKVLFIRGENSKIIDLIIDKLYKHLDLSSYRIDIPEDMLSYINYKPILKNRIEIYSILEYREEIMDNSSKPYGQTEIIRNTMGVPIEARISIKDEIKASSTIFWMSDTAAELSIECCPYAGEGKWVIYVLSTHASELKKINIKSLYLVSEKNLTSRNIAEQVGFIDTGRRIVEITGTLG